MKIVESKEETGNKINLARDKIFSFLFFFFFFALAILIRYNFRDFETGDYSACLSPWMDFISKNGMLNAFQYKFSDYNPPYLHLLSFFTLLPLEKLYFVKMLSIFFDLALAVIVGLIVNRKYQNKVISGAAFFAILFLPTVILNGSFWGQCDVIFTTFSVLGIYFLMSKKKSFALISIGMAFAFKFQAAFLFPFLLALYLKKDLRLRYFFWIPAVLFLSFVPSLIAGRSLASLLAIYLNQAGAYERLSLNAPSVFSWFSDDYFTFLNQSGILFAVFVGLTFGFFVYKSRKKINEALIVKLALASALLMPFFLPQMHERYFFLADIISVVYAFYNPRKFYVAIVIIGVSFFSYFPYLFGHAIFELPYLAVILGVVIAIVVYDLLKELYADSFN